MRFPEWSKGLDLSSNALRFASSTLAPHKTIIKAYYCFNSGSKEPYLRPLSKVALRFSCKEKVANSIFAEGMAITILY